MLYLMLRLIRKKGRKDLLARYIKIRELFGQL